MDFTAGGLQTQDKSKPILFSMARLDRVKNMSGLVEWFAKSTRLRKVVNLVIVAGLIDPADSNDHEEKAQCKKVGGGCTAGLLAAAAVRVRLAVCRVVALCCGWQRWVLS